MDGIYLEIENKKSLVEELHEYAFDIVGAADDAWRDYRAARAALSMDNEKTMRARGQAAEAYIKMGNVQRDAYCVEIGDEWNEIEDSGDRLRALNSKNEIKAFLREIDKMAESVHEVLQRVGAEDMVDEVQEALDSQ